MDVPHIASHMLYAFTRGCSLSDDTCRDEGMGIVSTAARAAEVIDLVLEDHLTCILFTSIT